VSCSQVNCVKSLFRLVKIPSQPTGLLWRPAGLKTDRNETVWLSTMNLCSDCWRRVRYEAEPDEQAEGTEGEEREGGRFGDEGDAEAANVVSC
jgi:hypothetical protein